MRMSDDVACQLEMEMFPELFMPGVVRTGATAGGGGTEPPMNLRASKDTIGQRPSRKLHHVACHQVQIGTG